MNSPRNLESLEIGRHVGLICDSLTEGQDIVSSFLRQGWMSGDRCICVTDEPHEGEWRLKLQSHGIELDSAESTGAFVIGRNPNRGAPVDFRSVRLARDVVAFVQESMLNYRAVRFAVDVGASLGRELSSEQLCHWEATFDSIHPGEAMRTICMYARDTLAADVIHAALRTHPLVLLDSRLRTNPFYEAPAILEQEPNLNASDADAADIERMITELWRSV